MNETLQKKIRIYTNYLRKKLLSSGCNREYVNSLSDEQILEDFRKCADCDEEIVTKDQQMHAIYEFDTPERIFEVTYEGMEYEDCVDSDSESLDLAQALDGCKTMSEVISKMMSLTKHLAHLHGQGKKLVRPVGEGLIEYE